jgi:hypothetical protein
MKLINLAIIAIGMCSASAFGQDKNTAPKIEYISIDGKRSPSVVPLNPGEKYLVRVAATDPDGDKLKAQWELFEKTELLEATNKKRKPVAIPDMVTGSLETVMLDVPVKQGKYRLILTVIDSFKNSSTAGIDLLVL